VGSSAENRLDQFFGSVSHGRISVGEKGGFLQLNRFPVAIHVGNAFRAFGYMALEFGAHVDGQVAAQIVVKKLSKFTASHTSPPATLLRLKEKPTKKLAILGCLHSAKVTNDLGGAWHG
jgi:hypothetical protein